MAALHLWRSVFICKGQAGCFAVEFPMNWSEHLSTLPFLFLNALVGVTNILKCSSLPSKLHMFSKVQLKGRVLLCVLLTFSHLLKFQTSGKVCKL